MTTSIMKRLALALGAAAVLGISGAATASASDNITQPQLVSLAAVSVDAQQPVPASVQGVFDGLWVMTQSNGAVVQMFLSAPDGGGRFAGFASFSGGTGNIVGQLSGSDVVFDIRWNFGHTGRYFGRLGSGGQWSGTAVDLNDPSSQATWFARRG
jgi:hypothetical protein